MKTFKHKVLLIVSSLILMLEFGFLCYYYQAVFNWLSNNLWLVLVPFIKVIIKKLITIKAAIFFKAFGVLFINFMKLVLLKFFKTLTVRYGVYFTQRKWNRVRWCKVMFLRKGKLFFRELRDFWTGFNKPQKILVWLAFFPFVLLSVILNLSFNLTQKTMVDKKQQPSSSNIDDIESDSKGTWSWVSRLDKKVLAKIKALT